MVKYDKVSGFRLPQETLDKIDEIIKMGKAKNRTEAVILAIDMSNNLIRSESTPDLAEITEKQGREIEELKRIVSLQQEGLEVNSRLLKIILTKPDQLEKFRNDMLSKLKRIEKEEHNSEALSNEDR
jgi:Arc/MetJ-type ribon-helix-helix transcriptional regulator